MHIDVFKGKGKQPWRWHKVNRGRITCSAEGFPTKAHAIRAAKADVAQTLKPLDVVGAPVAFRVQTLDGITRIEWS